MPWNYVEENAKSKQISCLINIRRIKVIFWIAKYQEMKFLTVNFSELL